MNRAAVLSAAIVVVAALACDSASCAEQQLIRATWLHERWLQTFDESEVNKLCSVLNTYKINTVYPRLAFGSKALIPGRSEEGWVPNPDAGRQFIAVLRARCPGIRIIPYRGVIKCGEVVDGRRQTLWNTPALRSSSVNALWASMDVLGADGIQYDLECSDIDDLAVEQGVAGYFAALKAKLGPNKILSVAIPILSQQVTDYAQPELQILPWTNALLAAPARDKLGRAPHVYRALFSQSDEVAIMLYDTGVTEAQGLRFEALVAAQCWAGAWFSRGYGAKFLPGIRLSVTNSKRYGHYHSVENPIRSRRGIGAALSSDLGNGELASSHIHGIAVFRLDVQFEQGWSASAGQPYVDELRDWFTDPPGF